MTVYWSSESPIMELRDGAQGGFEIAVGAAPQGITAWLDEAQLVDLAEGIRQALGTLPVVPSLPPPETVPMPPNPHDIPGSMLHPHDPQLRFAFVEGRLQVWAE